MTYEEAAEYMGYAPKTLRNLVWQRKLCRPFTREDLDRYLCANPRHVAHPGRRK